MKTLHIKNRIFMLLMVAGCLSFAQASTIKLSGVISDAGNGEAIRGATVEIENTFFGTITDNSGRFSINTSTPMPFWVVCKRAGYQPVRMQVAKTADIETVKLKRQGGNAAGGAAKEVEVSAPEYRAKLAFIERFAQMTTFPNEASRPAGEAFHIGIFGANPFGEDVFILESHTVNSHKIDIRFTDSLAGLETLDVLFLPTLRNGDTRLEAIIQAAEKHSILLIADDKKMLSRGAMIAFALEGSNIRFVVNKAAVEKAKLVLAPALLNIASPE